MPPESALCGVRTLSRLLSTAQGLASELFFLHRCTHRANLCHICIK
jgi:hypothetical protein